MNAATAWCRTTPRPGNCMKQRPATAARRRRPPWPVCWPRVPARNRTFRKPGPGPTLPFRTVTRMPKRFSVRYPPSPPPHHNHHHRHHHHRHGKKALETLREELAKNAAAKGKGGEVKAPADPEKKEEAPKSPDKSNKPEDGTDKPKEKTADSPKEKHKGE